MSDKRDERRRPLELKFFLVSGGWFVGVGTGITGLAPMQPDLQAFVDLVSSNRWNLLSCYMMWTGGHLMLDALRRSLEFQREVRRSDPAQPRIAAKRAEVKRRRRQSAKDRRKR